MGNPSEGILLYNSKQYHHYMHAYACLQYLYMHLVTILSLKTSKAAQYLEVPTTEWP